MTETWIVRAGKRRMSEAEVSQQNLSPPPPPLPTPPLPASFIMRYVKNVSKKLSIKPGSNKPESYITCMAFGCQNLCSTLMEEGGWVFGGGRGESEHRTSLAPKPL